MTIDGPHWNVCKQLKSDHLHGGRRWGGDRWQGWEGGKDWEEEDSYKNVLDSS